MGGRQRGSTEAIEDRCGNLGIERGDRVAEPPPLDRADLG
jgi:hypothetical protein